MPRRSDLAIINRSFWPVYPVIGEALLRFAENAACQLRVSVILQDHADIRSALSQQGRGKGVAFYPCKAWTTSASGIARRIVDAAFFMIWVMGVLLWNRPRKVYVSTDPPVLVPFIVMVYAKLFRASYVYHLQDIHPEATNVVVPVNRLIYRCLRWIDGLVMRQASRLITITREMADEICRRSGTHADVVVLSNPAVSFEGVNPVSTKRRGFSFCGNAGRLQRIPLLVDAIERYLDAGGSLEFAFAGGGVFAPALERLANQYSQVHYYGLISATEAAQLNANYEWALLPIEDEVTRYAFPSKSSSYVFSGAFILAVCGEQTSVAEWVTSNRLGLVVEPEAGALANTFARIEEGSIETDDLDSDRSELKRGLSFECFIEQLSHNILDRNLVE
ncbi:glycosyltransferase [Marinobacter salinisoli]|uniref:Glycosyltransferase n=1 Tax=Marinobacter salinisoli TaxID=2769486 RepID=A0ABX7MSU4_9GAMM|nr:glycosyltransferase [Marinobacter salinisoli]QSP94469.1 glycosyltransferase [Marinobacter salinisoli]